MLPRTASSPSLARQILDFLRAPEYYAQVFKLGVPIAFQNFVMSLLNMVGTMMIGQLGDVPIAAVGLANQVFFLLNLTLFGVTSGAAMFTAQLWGKRDIGNIRKVLGICVMLSLAASLPFVLIAEFAPHLALRLYTDDQAVLALGGDYLRIFGLTFLLAAVTFSYAAVLRSIGEIKVPLAVSIAALGLNLVVSYGLIFGVGGLPRMGIMGSAVATLLARIFELVVLLWLIYTRQSPVAAPLKELLSLDFSFAWKVLRPVLPVAANELLWSLGITTYNSFYAHIGTEAYAAMNIVTTIDSMAMVAFIGLGNACAILIGNQIGAEENPKAMQYAGRTLLLAPLGGLAMAGIIRIASGPLLALYKVSPETNAYAHQIIFVLVGFFWLRMMNYILFIAILRSGGDTRFAMILDGLIIWVVGVPLAYVGTYVLHWPVYGVYLLTMSEELVKWGLALWRFSSRRWIHNLAQTV